ncbi:hypothetical protein PFISCL1PPCAC_8376, partial [Pristionchus fissidentatus]
CAAHVVVSLLVHSSPLLLLALSSASLPAMRILLHRVLGDDGAALQVAQIDDDLVELAHLCVRGEDGHRRERAFIHELDEHTCRSI